MAVIAPPATAKPLSDLVYAGSVGGFFRVSASGRAHAMDGWSNGTTTRRGILRAGGMAAGAVAIASVSRSARAGGSAPETPTAKLGYIALTDAAPVIVAKAKGFFDRHGMTDVTVAKQASWGGTRDNLELGSGGGGIDGAHILTPMPYFMTLGTITKNKLPVPMAILARLSLNGQGISVEQEYLNVHADLGAAKMKPIIAKRKASGRKIVMAMTFPGGTHDLWLRYWLAASGINPDVDVDLITIPPPQMVANMKAQTMEAFCVGEPWNAQLVAQKIGYTAVSTGQLWLDHPEKSFAMRADWVAAHPKAAVALTAAIIEAQQWCDDPKNLVEMVAIVSSRDWFKVPATDIQDRLAGTFDFGDGRVVKSAPYRMKFWANHASYPYRSHDLWFLTENQRWGKLPPALDTTKVIAAVNREDVWRAAAAAAKVSAGAMPKSQSRGVEHFFDGKTFDPAKPAAYLASLTIRKA
jgi:nitrate/nitrite transport system substrate-binding protein